MEVGPNGDGPHNEAHATTSVRLPWPTMMRDNIELWFIQIDHWFTVNRITSDNTRFSTVVAALDPNLLQQIYETVRNPPVANKYDALRNAVIRNFTESEQRRAQQFVSGLQLGDKRPSHLLNELRRIGGENQDENFVKVLWMNRLPIQVQTCLAASASPLNDLAILADSVMETFRIGESFNVNVVRPESNHPSTSNIAAASSSSAATNNTAKVSDSDALSKLAAQVKELARQMARMHNGNAPNRSGRSNERSSSRQRGRSATPANGANGENNEDDGQCWYHRTYGPDARKCRDPCNAPKN